MTKKYQKLQELQHSLEEPNQKLEEELNMLNNETQSHDKVRHSFSSNEKKVDLFNSEVDINIIDSIDEENDFSKKDYCNNCLKMFDIDIQYDVQSIENVLEMEINDFVNQIDSQNEKKREIIHLVFFNELFNLTPAMRPVL